MFASMGGMAAVAAFAGVFVAACFVAFGGLRRLNAADAKLRAYFDKHPEKSHERKLMQEAGYKV